MAVTGKEDLTVPTKKKRKKKKPEPKTALEALKPKQRAFVIHYLEHFNAAKAAREAGYSEKCDYKIGSENLRKPDIAQAIAEQLDILGITAERVKSELAKIAFDNDQMAFEEWLKGWKSLEQLQAEGVNTQLVKSISLTKTGRKVELYSRIDALRELVRVLGLITETRNVKHSGAIEHQHKADLSALLESARRNGQPAKRVEDTPAFIGKRGGLN